MPNRIIKESICESAGLSKCSVFAQDLYKRLLTYADDYGRFNADTEIMLARLYPRELDSVSQQDIIQALIDLSGYGKVAFYTSNARKTVYGCFPNWAEHQRMRESKAKCPDPDDTTVNDWYLQRFIPLDLRIEIIERDGFKCQVCKKFITTDTDAKRLAKHGDGMYHIDHIVPVYQGGRATAENLRLTCPTCNQKRKKEFSFSEIVKFSLERGNLRQDAASRANSPPESNPNPNPNPKGNITPLPPLDEFSEPMQSAIRDWVSYKAERRETYKPTGLKQFLSMARNAVQKYGDDAVLFAFNQSMGANYQGVVWEKAQKYKAEPPDNYYQRLN